jgi:putative polyhydroxyalkanoate system protein
MPDIRIERTHDLGLARAREISAQWLASAQREFGMTCTADAGIECDTIHFERSGVNGTVTVDGQRFVLQARLGFLLGSFKDRIVAEIEGHLDRLLKA